MKYWKENEVSPVENMQFWQGTTITKLEPNEIFVMVPTLFFHFTKIIHYTVQK